MPGMDDDITFTGWRKIRRSFSNGGCVEVASAARRKLVAVRDTRDRGGPVLLFGGSTWGRFVAGLKAGPAAVSSRKRISSVTRSAR